MKKVLIIILSTVLIACSNSKSTTITKTENGVNIESGKSVETTSDKTITLPFSFFTSFDDSITKEDIISSLEESKNSDAIKEFTITEENIIITIDGAEYSKTMNEMKANIDESLISLINDEKFGFKEITYNEDMSKFTVILTENELSFAGSFSTIAFYMQGSIYQMFLGKTQDTIDVQIDFIASNGEIVNTAKLSDFAQNN